MAVPRLSQGLVNYESALDNFALWPNRELLRIEALPDAKVLTELQDIMDGRSYSWEKINQFLQEQLDNDTLEFTLEDGDAIFEWNNLCDEKRQWEKERHLSASCAEFNRDCLINLKIIPIQGGLGFEESQLVTTNSDEPNVSIKDLGVYPDKWEMLTDSQSIESRTDDDNSWNSEETEESTDEDDDDEYQGYSYELVSSDSEEEWSE